MALFFCSKYGICKNDKIQLRESISELLSGKHVCVSSRAWHIFLMVDQEAVKGAGYSYCNTWAGLGHLLAEKPSSEKEKLCIWCCCCFQALLASRKRKSCLHHRNDCVVSELKPENPTLLLDANSAFTKANVKCKDVTMVSGRRKRITPFHLEVIQSTGSYLSELMFGEFISLLMTRLHQHDHVPIWSTQMCGRFNLEPAHVILSSLGSKIAEWVE